MAAPTHTAQGAEIVAWSRRYTENPYDGGHTICRPCGDPFWDLQDWDMVMDPVEKHEILSYPLATHCASCGVDILDILAENEIRPDKYEVAAAIMESWERE